MNSIRVSALAGGLGMILAGVLAAAQAGTTAGSPQTNPTAASPQPPAAEAGQNTAGTGQAGGSASMQGTQAKGNRSRSKTSDKKFIKKAILDSEAEIKLGRTVQQNASDPNVKEYGQKMIDDHSKMKEQMMPIAQQMGIKLPSTLPPKLAKRQEKLQGLSGAEFDKAYMSAMVKDHSKDVPEFRHEANDAQNPQVKEAAQKAAPVIEEHLQLAQQVAEKVGAKSGKMAKNSKSSNGANPPADNPSPTLSNTPATPSTTTSPQ